MLGLSKVKVRNSGDCLWAHPHYIFKLRKE